MNYDMPLERLPGTVRKNTPSDSSDLSFWQKLFPRDRWTRAAVIWSFCQFVVISVLEGLVLKIHNDYVDELQSAAFPIDPSTGQVPPIVPNAKALIVYQALFICGQAFQLYLCMDAIVSLSVIQLMATAAFNYALFGYSIMQFNQAMNILSASDLATLRVAVPGIVPHPTETFEYAIIGLMALSMIVWTVLGFKLYRIFGWSLYKEMGADVSVMRSLRVYHIYLMFVKLDVFFFFGFDVQFLVLVLINQQNDLNSLIIHAAVAIPLTVILLMFAYYGVRYENRIMTIFTLGGLIGAITYLTLKVVDIWTTSDKGKYLSSRKSLTFFISLTIVMSAITFILGIMNYLQFGRGLKEKLHRRGSSADHYVSNQS